MFEACPTQVADLVNDENRFPVYVKFHHRSLGLLGALFKRFKTGAAVEDWLSNMASKIPVIYFGQLEALAICVKGLVATESMQKGSVKTNWMDRVLLVQRTGVTPEHFEKTVRETAPEVADAIGDWRLDRARQILSSSLGMVPDCLILGVAR